MPTNTLTSAWMFLTAKLRGLREARLRLCPERSLETTCHPSSLCFWPQLPVNFPLVISSSETSQMLFLCFRCALWGSKQAFVLLSEPQQRPFQTCWQWNRLWQLKKGSRVHSTVKSVRRGSVTALLSCLRSSIVSQGGFRLWPRWLTQVNTHCYGWCV